MADDQPKGQIRRIKIKFGNHVVATQAVRVSGRVSSASQDSKDVKSSSALRLAKAKQASLRNYVSPTASADAIVARLREGEGFAPGAELSAWDFPAPPTQSCEERPAKRSKHEVFSDGGCLEPSSCVSPDTTGQAAARADTAGAGPRRPEAPASVKVTPSKPQPVGLPERTAAAAAAATAVGSGESNSDQATTSQVYLPLSPDDGVGGEGAGRVHAPGALCQPNGKNAGQSALASSAQANACGPQQQQRSRPSVAAASKAPKPPGEAAACTSATVSASLAPSAGKRAGATAAATTTTTTTTSVPAYPGGMRSPAPPFRAADAPPLTSCRHHEAPPPPQHQPQLLQGAPASPPADAATPQPAGVSVGSQTAQRDFPILPTSFLELPRLSGTAASYQSIGPFDLQLEGETSSRAAELSHDKAIDAAKLVKREGDAIFQKVGYWNIKGLSKYVSASLMFMEATDTLLRERRDSRHTSNVIRAADLYKQTAVLLEHALSYTDKHLQGNGIGREALRLLAERLCAICLLRQASLLGSSFQRAAEKAQTALREHQRQQAAQAQGAAGTAGGGQQPSPEDSSTSSLNVAHGGAVSGGTSRPPHPGSGGPVGASTQGAQAGAHGPAAAAQCIPGLGHDQVSELAGYAKTTCRFAEYMKRSSKSFEAFLERADVRQDQQAKIVCMHLAAVCVDMGMMPGKRVIYHAREALRTLCDDLAR